VIGAQPPFPGTPAGLKLGNLVSRVSEAKIYKSMTLNPEISVDTFEHGRAESASAIAGGAPVPRPKLVPGT